MSSKTAPLGQGLPSTRPAGHHPREASGGAFTQFSQDQVKQFKEAFNMIDQDGDGRVTESDLRKMLEELGQTPKPALMASLLTSPSGHPTSSINFTQFVTMMGERLRMLDPEPDVVEAFAAFDEGDKGWVDVKVVRKQLAELGDRMSEAELDRLFSGPHTDRQGRFHYLEFAKMLRVNDGEEARDDRLIT